MKQSDGHLEDQRDDGAPDGGERAAVRVEVIDEGAILSTQARSYAEYRVFASLSRHAREVRGASMEFRRDVRGPNGIVCVVSVALAPIGLIQIRATAKHPYAAIDRAAQRVADAMQDLTAAFGLAERNDRAQR
jgi:hypothetical protein